MHFIYLNIAYSENHPALQPLGAAFQGALPKPKTRAGPTLGSRLSSPKVDGKSQSFTVIWWWLITKNGHDYEYEWSTWKTRIYQI